MQHTNILAQLDPGHNLEDSLDSADLLKAQGNVSVNGNPPCVVRSLLPRMTAPGDIGGAGSSNMDIISLYDNEFPLLKVNGLYAALTSGDGDCLFHSLSDQVCLPLPPSLPRSLSVFPTLSLFFSAASWQCLHSNGGSKDSALCHDCLSPFSVFYWFLFVPQFVLTACFLQPALRP